MITGRIAGRTLLLRGPVKSRVCDAYAWNGAYTLNRPYTTNGLNQYSNAGTRFLYDGDALVAEYVGGAINTYDEYGMPG